MTVCVATLFIWNYGTLEAPEFGVGAITASDQMITAGDVQYEPTQQKVAYITPTTILLIAGDYSVHSEALQATLSHVRGDQSISPQRVALIYGQEIQRIKRREAEDVLLAPFGLNTDSFLAQQKDMTDSFVEHLANQLQNYSGRDVEAIVVGSDKANSHIYYVDSNGSSHCMDDVSFHAIGLGAWHAKSQLMQYGYTKHGRFYADALARTYAAKRRAEVAPGVGSRTDIHVVLRSHEFKVSDPIMEKLEELYLKYIADTQRLATESISELEEFFNGERATKDITPQHDQENNGKSGDDAAQTARESEGEKQTSESDENKNHQKKVG